MPWKDIFKELSILLGLALVTAFGVNGFSPAGIALVGEWDTARGVITAKPKKNDVVDHGLEIQDPAVAKSIYDRGRAVFADARAADDFAEGHIKGALSLPTNQFEARIGAFKAAYPAETEIVTYCSGRECGDSHKLARFLMLNGYFNVRVFIDGFPGWKVAGYPIE